MKYSFGGRVRYSEIGENGLLTQMFYKLIIYD